MLDGESLIPFSPQEQLSGIIGDILPPGLSIYRKSGITRQGKGEMLVLEKGTAAARDRFEFTKEGRLIVREYSQLYYLDWNLYVASNGQEGKMPVNFELVSSGEKAIAMVDRPLSPGNVPSWLIEEDVTQLAFNKQGGVEAASLRRKLEFVKPKTDGSMPHLGCIPDAEMEVKAKIFLPSNQQGWRIQFQLSRDGNVFVIKEAPFIQYTVGLTKETIEVKSLLTDKVVLNQKKEKSNIFNLNRLSDEQWRVFEEVQKQIQIVLGVDINSFSTGSLAVKLIDEVKKAIKKQAVF